MENDKELCRLKDPQKVKYPKTNAKILKFMHHEREVKHPFVGCKKFKSLLVKQTKLDNTCISKKLDIEKYRTIEKHIPYAFGFYSIITGNRTYFQQPGDDKKKLLMS